jgi:hypothetical protein
MTITPAKIADFVIWLASPPWQPDRQAVEIYLKPTEEQVKMLYGAWKALSILERLAGNSDAREADIGRARDLFERMVAQCAYENRPKPDATVDINTEDLPALQSAATYLVEFQLRKEIEDADDKRRTANRGTYRGKS